jgi:hypothetical protein
MINAATALHAGAPQIADSCGRGTERFMVQTAEHPLSVRQAIVSIRIFPGHCSDATEELEAEPAALPMKDWKSGLRVYVFGAGRHDDLLNSRSATVECRGAIDVYNGFVTARIPLLQDGCHARQTGRLQVKIDQ